MANTFEPRLSPSSTSATSEQTGPVRGNLRSLAGQGYAAASAALSPASALQLKSRAKKPPPGTPNHVQGTFTVSGRTYELRGGSLYVGEALVGAVPDIAAVAQSLEAGKLPASITATLGAEGDAAASIDLIGGAATGSTLKYERKAWSLYEGSWQELKRNIGKGFSKFGGGTVRKGLTALNAEGKLGLASTGKMVLTPEQIAILDAIAQVETSGSLGGVNTYDNMIVSLGFKQVTLGWKSLEQMMDWAPAGFSRHGLTVDKSKTYPKSDNIKADGVHQISGVENPQQLRQAEWAVRFYNASLEPDVISAQVRLALGDLAKVDKATGAAKSPGGFFDDPTARAWLLETYNNRHSFMALAVKKAKALGADTATDRTAFLDLLAQAIIATYVENEPLIHYKEKKRRSGKLSEAEDAALLARMKAKYEPVGTQKGTNIVTKIPRTLPGLDAAPVQALPAAAPVEAPMSAGSTDTAPGMETPAPAAVSTVLSSADAEDLVADLMGQGWRDENDLTNELFWRSNELLRGQRLQSGSPQANEWLTLRDSFVRPALGAPEPMVTATVSAMVAATVASPSAAAPKPVVAPPLPARATPPAPAPQPVRPAAPAPARAPAAPVRTSAAPAPASPAPPAGGGVLSKDEALSAIGSYRSNPLEPSEMAQLQRHLGLPGHGAIDVATVDALAAYRLARLSGKAPKRRARIALGVPDAAALSTFGIARVNATVTMGRSTRGADASAPAEDAALAAFGHANYGAYLATLKTMTFLGQTVTGHPDFLTRLGLAERYLLSLHPGQTSKGLGALFGITQTSSLRLSTEKSPQLNHGIGFAVDLNPDLNPWVFANTGRAKGNQVFNNVASRLTRFLGLGDVVTGRGLSAATRHETTEELFGKMSTLDAGFETWRGMAKLPDDALRARVEARLTEDPSLRTDGDAAFWMKTIRGDDKGLTGYLDAMGEEEYAKHGNGGIMDLKLSVVKAMRDVAGLRWGAVDQGGENGDTMHFDGYGTITRCTELRDAIRTEEQARRAKK